MCFVFQQMWEAQGLDFSPSWDFGLILSGHQISVQHTVELCFSTVSSQCLPLLCYLRGRKYVWMGTRYPSYTWLATRWIWSPDCSTQTAEWQVVYMPHAVYWTLKECQVCKVKHSKHRECQNQGCAFNLNLASLCICIRILQLHVRILSFPQAPHQCTAWMCTGDR